jgi:hypothetical protein
MKTVEERIKERERREQETADLLTKVKREVSDLVDELKHFAIGDFAKKRLISYWPPVDVFFSNAGPDACELRLAVAIDQVLREMREVTYGRSSADGELLELQLMSLIIYLRLQRNGRKQSLRDAREEGEYLAEKARARREQDLVDAIADAATAEIAKEEDKKVIRAVRRIAKRRKGA